MLNDILANWSLAALYWTTVGIVSAYAAFCAILQETRSKSKTIDISAEVTNGIRDAKQAGYLHPDRFKF